MPIDDATSCIKQEGLILKIKVLTSIAEYIFIMKQIIKQKQIVFKYPIKRLIKEDYSFPTEMEKAYASLKNGYSITQPI